MLTTGDLSSQNARLPQKRPMALILPAAKQPAPRHPIAMPVSQFYSHLDVVGTKATAADIIQEIQMIPRSEALRWLCGLSKGILSERGVMAETQLQWARELLPSEWCDKLEAMMRSDGIDAGRIFHRRVVWFVLQLVVMSCRKAATDMPNKEVAERLGRACFMASDVLSDIESEFENSLSDDVTEWMVAVLVLM